MCVCVCVCVCVRVCVCARAFVRACSSIGSRCFFSAPVLLFGIEVYASFDPVLDQLQAES